jgi:hypothetical protein
MIKGVSQLLWTLDEEEGDDFRSQLVLEGMKIVLSINSNDVLPYLIPAKGTSDARFRRVDRANAF